MNVFNPFEVVKTKYVFFTGKGSVGKTSAACATAVSLADSGKSVMLTFQINGEVSRHGTMPYLLKYL